MNDISPKQFKWVGTRPIRPDGVPKVTGRAQYGADMAMPGMLWGKVIRSPHAHARIRSIDASKALALPGVKAVVTAADIPDQKFAYVGPERVQQNAWHIARHDVARDVPGVLLDALRAHIGKFLVGDVGRGHNRLDAGEGQSL